MTDEIEFFTALEEENRVIAQANLTVARATSLRTCSSRGCVVSSR